MIIGLSGYAQSGKSTVAAYLVERYGFRQIAFADALRDIAEILNPIVDWDPNLDQPTRYKDVLWARGYEEAKRLPEVRRFLQVLGTEVGRDRIHDNVWVDLAWKSVQPGEDVVFSDMRFPNEVASLDVYGGGDGVLWRVTRPGFGPINGHSSETAVDDVSPDVLLSNTGFLDDLYVQVDDALADLSASIEG